MNLNLNLNLKLKLKVRIGLGWLNRNFVGPVNWAVVCALGHLIRWYQRYISPMLGPRCRFYPTCSDYCLISLRKYGCVRGIGKTVGRLCKCQPFHKGGIDFP